ncbi:PREDICTED: putative selection and upkeep of intraepithelial T-cells protein 1 homolog, partial [Miniopterus natalensis]|uniref:putative selection and upkeep of intraepithelial T-cells protein 1 homolog n=1 Tax=Miniopterus natalensis TaxID=291302 RepID=UPI0007A6A9C2
KWTVTIPTGHLVATVGGKTELSCQLSPPQSAEHMEVSWFKGDRSRLVHLYRDGHEVKGKAAQEYVDRTEFVKEAIGEGKVTLRIHNISISDNGLYQCSFKDGNFSDVASMNLSVAALGLGTQIHIWAPTINGLTVECDSGGWFPQPEMEWRDSKGEVVPHSSKSYAQNGAGLFQVKMTLLLRNKSQDHVVCYIRNPLSGEGKQISLILNDSLFLPVHTWLIILISLSFLILLVITVLFGCRCFKNPVLGCDFIRFLNSIFSQALCFVCFCVILGIYLLFRIRVSIPDPFFSLYNNWIWDITWMVGVLMLFYIALIYFLYFTVRGKWSRLVMTLICPFSSTYLYSIPCKVLLSVWLLA